MRKEGAERIRAIRAAQADEAHSISSRAPGTKPNWWSCNDSSSRRAVPSASSLILRHSPDVMTAPHHFLADEIPRRWSRELPEGSAVAEGSRLMTFFLLVTEQSAETPPAGHVAGIADAETGIPVEDGEAGIADADGLALADAAWAPTPPAAAAAEATFLRACFKSWSFSKETTPKTRATIAVAATSAATTTRAHRTG